MIDAEKFVKKISDLGGVFYTGVPDSLLKNLCKQIEKISKKNNHIIASNEGSAIALAIGYHLATNKIPIVYMQNSGLGNAINPLVSLASKRIYQIPIVLIIGWRGDPDFSDEPQHLHQGECMLEILDAIGINTVVLSKEQTECSTQLTTIFEEAKNTSSPVAIIVKKNTFTEVKDHNPIINKYKMTRKEAIITATSLLPKSSLVVATTGMAGRELFEHRQQTSGDHSMDFLTVGGMGHANQIGLSMALCLPNKKVVCFDGDGALLMHLGSMGLIGQSRAENYIHILLNNGVHGSVGGQPTLGFEIDFVSLAKGFGYRNTALAYDQLGVEKSIEYLLDQPGPSFLEIRVSAKNQKNIGRPTSSPLNNKELFMKNIHGEKE